MNEFVASSLPRILTSAQWEPRKVESMAAQLTALVPATMMLFECGDNAAHGCEPALRRMPDDDGM